MSSARRAVTADRKNDWSVPYEAAERAYERADYEHCLTLLGIAKAMAPAQAAGAVDLLRARTARLLGDDQTSYVAAASATRECETAGERLAAFALHAFAAKHLGKVAESRRLFASLAPQLSAATAAETSEAHYVLALSALEDDDFDGAQALLAPNVHATAHQPESIALAATVEMARSRYREAALLFAKAQRRSNGSVHVRFDAVVLSSLAAIAAETVDLELGKRVRSAYEKMVWPASLTPERFAATSALRTLALLEGDLAGAYFFAREAVQFACEPALEALAETRLAAVVRMLGDLGSERLQLRRAWDLLRPLGAEPFDAAVVYALSAFAAGGHRLLPAEARKAMSLRRALVAEAPSALDARLEALGAVAAARVAESAGDRTVAVRQYRQALAHWQRLGIDLRIALAAVDLRRLTGDDAYAKIARPIVARAPKAWFAPDLKRSRSPVSRLTAAERVVLARLLRGESAKAIGEALERSPFTISNHTRKIFAAFELNSRSKVIARCVELGITPESIERDG